MSDSDNLFEYLHMAIVQYFVETNKSKEELLDSLETLGYRVGYGLIEKLVFDTLRMVDEVGIMKFICKEFWITVYSKQVDNLRTNNSGIFVLQDNSFRFLTQMSNGKQYADVSDRYLAFSCGLIRGALTNLGYTCKVTAEVPSMPICRFQVMLQPNLIKQSLQSQQLQQSTSTAANQGLSAINTSVASLSISATAKTQR